MDLFTVGGLCHQASVVNLTQFQAVREMVPVHPRGWFPWIERARFGLFLFSFTVATRAQRVMPGRVKTIDTAASLPSAARTCRRLALKSMTLDYSSGQRLTGNARFVRAFPETFSE